MKTPLVLIQVIAVIASIILSLSISALLLVGIGRNPFEVVQVIWDGSFADSNRLAGVFNFWIPFTLASLGLVVTFRAGLWNIGVEGQMMFGAIFASGVVLFVDAPSIVTVPLAFLSAMLGGMVWGVAVGLLKIRLGVHEIFGGVALNALANVFTNFLVSNLFLCLTCLICFIVLTVNVSIVFNMKSVNFIKIIYMYFYFNPYFLLF